MGEALPTLTGKPWAERCPSEGPSLGFSEECHRTLLTRFSGFSQKCSFLRVSPSCRLTLKTGKEITLICVSRVYLLFFLSFIGSLFTQTPKCKLFTLLLLRAVCFIINIIYYKYYIPITCSLIWAHGNNDFMSLLVCPFVCWPISLCLI